MTTVTEAYRELAQIAERKAELQAIVDAAPKFLLISNAYLETGNSIPSWMTPCPVDREVAKAYAEALDTLLMLRHQPGSEPASDDTYQCVLIPRESGGVSIDAYSAFCHKAGCISPCYETREAAQAAIGTIGADRILRMFRTLHGVA